MITINDLPDNQLLLNHTQLRRRVGNLCIGPKIPLSPQSNNHQYDSSNQSDNNEIFIQHSSDISIPSDDESKINPESKSDSSWEEVQYINGATCTPPHEYQAEAIEEWLQSKEEKKETDDIQYIAYKTLLEERFPPKTPKRKKLSEWTPFENCAVWAIFLLHYSPKYHYTELQTQGLIDALLLLQHEGVIPNDFYLPKSVHSITESRRYLVDIPLS